MSVGEYLKRSLNGAYYTTSGVVFVLLALTGLVGMIVYGVFANIGGPIWIRNQFIGLWFATLLLFSALQGLYILLKPEHTLTGKGHFAGLVYISVMTLLALMLMIFGGLSSSTDAVVWSSVVYSNYLSTLILMILKRKALKNESRTEDMPLSDTKTFHTQPAKTPGKVILRVVQGVNWFLRVLFVLFTCLLLTGLIVDGVGRQKFKPRGEFLRVPLSDNSGRTLKIHFKCDGPKNGPVFMFEGSGSHGMADYFGLQRFLKVNNRRSCIWDKPGLGYSDYLYTDMKANFSLVYDNFIKAIPETPPYVFVGWGGGGSLVYDFASRRPELVHSLVFLDVYPAGYEFQSQATLKNWTQDQLLQYKRQELASRSGLFRLINSIGVPFGLMSIFIPPYQPNPPDLADEVNWYFRTAKTWTTQRAFLEASFDDKDALDTETISPTIPLNIFMSKKTREQVINDTCVPRKLEPDSEKCLYEIKLNEYSIAEREKLADLSPINSKTYCTLDKCGLDYFVYSGSNFTVDALLKLYPV